MYYWDSYFTMLGLVESGRQDLVEHMSRLRLLDRHLWSRTERHPHYYLSRSQPPFFYAMVGLLSPKDPAASYARYLPELRREYAFWMQGRRGWGAARRIAESSAMPNGAVLNRYWTMPTRRAMNPIVRHRTGAQQRTFLTAALSRSARGGPKAAGTSALAGSPMAAAGNHQHH